MNNECDWIDANPIEDAYEWETPDGLIDPDWDTLEIG